MSKVIYVSPDIIEVSNTTTETIIFEFDFDEYSRLVGESKLLGESSGFRLVLSGIIAENVGTTPQVTFKTYLNTTSVNVGANNISGTVYFKYEFTCLPLPGLNKQPCIAELYIGSAPASGTDHIGLSASTHLTEDLSDSCDLKTTITLTEASEDFSLTKYTAYLEVL